MKNQKNVSESEKRFPHFGVLDAVIILLVITALVGIYFRYNIMDTILQSKNLKTYTVTFSIDNIRYTTPNYVNIGDEVYFGETGKHFGTLIQESDGMSEMAFSLAPASEYFTSEDGQVVKVSYPNNESRVDARGRLNCEGSVSELGGFLVGGSTYIAPGQTVNIRTEKVSVSIRILSIEVAEQK